MLNVSFTIDVEVWCDDWDRLDERFPGAFKSYIHGVGAPPNFGLDYQLRVLSEHGLTAICFVEPLFALRFGVGPLCEIIAIIHARGHEVQLHLHPEWASESTSERFPKIPGKRPYMSQFTLDEQTRMISAGLALLHEAGASNVTALRAGSFGMNVDTLTAAKACGLRIDCSYNACLNGRRSGLVRKGYAITAPVEIDGLIEVPMTVFRDGLGFAQHAQLTACSSSEMTHLLDQAMLRGHESFVVLSHGSELLNRARTRVDPVVVQRLQAFCEYAQRRRVDVHVPGFHSHPPKLVQQPTHLLQSSAWRTVQRRLEQIGRRRYR